MKPTTDTKERGSLLVEASFMISFMLLLLFGAIDISRAVNAAIVIDQAVFAGAEYRLSVPSALDTAITAAVSSDAPGITTLVPNVTHWCACSPGGALVSCSPNTCIGAQIKYLQVSGAATVKTSFPYLVIPRNIPVNASLTIRVQ